MRSESQLKFKHVQFLDYWSLIPGPYLSMIQLPRVILIPPRNLHHNVRGSVRHGLASQPRLRRNPRRFVQFIQLRVGRFVARLQPFFHHRVARGASAHSAAGMIDADFEAFGNVQNTAGNAVVTVRKLFRVDLDGFAAWQERDLKLLGRFLILYFLDIRIAAAHRFLPKLPSISCLPAPTAPRNSSAVPQGVRWHDSTHQSFSGSICNRSLAPFLVAPTLQIPR